MLQGKQNQDMVNPENLNILPRKHKFYLNDGIQG